MQNKLHKKVFRKNIGSHPMRMRSDLTRPERRYLNLFLERQRSKNVNEQMRRLRKDEREKVSSDKRTNDIVNKLTDVELKIRGAFKHV